MTTSFLTFYQSLDLDPLKRGKQFEHFVKWFLQNDPEWQTQVDQVWLWDEWPQRWGADCGVDLVFRHKNGEHWAVQAKCYSPDYDITKHDVDKFLSESRRKEIITHRLLIATTDGIGANARKTCDDHGVIRFLLSDFEKSALEYPASFSELPKAKRKPRPEPRDHQQEARAAVVQGLQTADRGQLIMACGTGKTYVTLWVKEALNAQRTLVLVPSLGLLSQLLREWTFAAATPFEVLCVCSDQTVGSKGNDEAIHSVADLAFPVTSDAEEVKRFLSGASNRVVFSTYQSSLVVAEAQADASIPAFDLAVADEAHRCAGKVGSDFTAILDNAQIRSVKRLFATATPRTYSSNVKKAAEERGVEVVGMDDAAKFGEVLYALHFGKAIERKLLTDYRVVIIGVDDPTIAQWIENRELVTTGTRITDYNALAAQIGLLKAIKDYDLKRIISFHSRVNRAEAFTTDMQNTMQWISDEHRPSGTLRTDFVSGNMPTNKRKIKLDQLKALNADERSVLSNARCLSEGVDVPSLDGVAFIDPRSSQVDIIQAVGRAIRLSSDKKAGTIVLPVFIAAGEDAASTIEASNFKPIWEVLNALKAHDDVLACELDNFRTEMGRKSGSTYIADELNKITIDLPESVDASFSSALRTHLVGCVTNSWDFFFGLLEAYVRREGLAKVVSTFVTDDGYRLGQWVAVQRATKVSLSLERKRRLDSIKGWTWTVLDEQWEAGFRYLKEFVEREGHAKPVSRYRTKDGFRLGQWVTVQRVRRGEISFERQARLEALSGWVWKALDEKWAKGFFYLKDFAGREGHTKIPFGYQTENGFRLGAWVNRQRNNVANMSVDRKLLFEKLAGWSWDPFADKWEEKFSDLLAYRAEYGDVNVPTSNASGLVSWMNNQRQNKRMGCISPTRIQKLDEVGFDWSPVESQWNENYEELVKFMAQHGHLDFSQRSSTRLVNWCNSQRQNRKNGILSEAQILRLDSIGFEWTPRDSVWMSGFDNLVAYKLKYGNLDVPKNSELGVWVGVQRRARKRGDISKDRIQLLDEIGFVWDALDFRWEKMFQELCAYKTLHGHLNMPTASEGLGSWVHIQRRAKRQGKLSEERIKRLDDRGFSWTFVDSSWDEKYSELVAYKAEHGNVNVPAKFGKLGQWVSQQRKVKKNEGISGDRLSRLEALGFVWVLPMSPPPRKNTDGDWLDRYGELLEFRKVHGHCKIPQSNERLNRWVMTQRQRNKIGKLSQERARLLDEIEFEWVVKRGRK
jgi:superfamily II DNA or RNA helicase